MPLIVLTGIPSSGKTTRAHKLKDYFEKDKRKKVVIVSELKEEDSRNEIYGDSLKEKPQRSSFKSDILRVLNKEDLIIADGLNYIKGFRYELYCGSKSFKTPQITIHCDISPEDAKSFNAIREPSSLRYSDEILSALVMRYEAPVYTNRWDSPLFLALKNKDLDYEDIHAALYERKPPPPNRSTQCQPLSSTNFLYELDQVTAKINSIILEGSRTRLGEDVGVPGSDKTVNIARTVTLPELNRTKRQFLQYAKSRAIDNMENLTTLYLQYINTSLFS